MNDEVIEKVSPLPPEQTPEQTPERPDQAARDEFRKKKKRKEIIYYVAKYGVSLLLIVFFMFPYLFMINKSLMPASELLAGDTHFFPRKIVLSNYSIVGQFFRNILNTLQVVLINGFFAPLTSCICAYPLARHKFAGKKFMFMLIMSTVLLPSSVLMVPQYFLYSQMQLVNTLPSQWIGAFWGGGALNIFLVIQFMRSIPKDVDNAARVDGANEYQIFFLIVFPLCFNIFLYLSLTMVMGLWMDFQGPLLYLSGAPSSRYTVGLAFYYYYTSSSNISANLQNKLMAMCVVMSLVPMLLFLFFQKQMIGGIKIGGVKG
jgi:multiple sugar transport system permease protein